MTRNFTRSLLYSLACRPATQYASLAGIGRRGAQRRDSIARHCARPRFIAGGSGHSARALLCPLPPECNPHPVQRRARHHIHGRSVRPLQVLCTAIPGSMTWVVYRLLPDLTCVGVAVVNTQRLYAVDVT
jgi:hypothetical protein